MSNELEFELAVFAMDITLKYTNILGKCGGNLSPDSVKLVKSLGDMFTTSAKEAKFKNEINSMIDNLGKN